MQGVVGDIDQRLPRSPTGGNTAKRGLGLGNVDFSGLLGIAESAARPSAARPASEVLG
ncbi:MAG: hypothetical protein MZV70_11980 [Desulfobacterales bacterium]|nr:hypothetical protein [Desulfobacterales bacterium]